MAKQVIIKSVREIFPFLIQSLLFIRTMNPFPKTPSMNSVTQTIINKFSTVLDMRVHKETLASTYHLLMDSSCTGIDVFKGEIPNEGFSY
jgi:hypothetical protein